MEGIIHAWGRILQGRAPSLSIEITRECPLRCPGCYAFGDDHLGGGLTLRQLHDYKGSELISRVLALVDEQRPVHVSLVGGEPLVRYRELETILPALAARGIHTQLVTSAVRPIPPAWANLRRLRIVVSIDGLQPEHDERRKPATYDRVLKHIVGHQITVHCTVTRQQTQREDYLDEFLAFWSNQPHVQRVWISLYTPQQGEVSPERLTVADRQRITAQLLVLRTRYPKLDMPEVLIRQYTAPPESPDRCVFARTTLTLSSDLNRTIEPCQFGGTPDCSSCGCIASAGLAAVGAHRLPGGLQVGTVLDASFAIGRTVARWRRRRTSSPDVPDAGDAPMAVTDAGTADV